MTEQEALALKPGDRVEAKISGKWRVVEFHRFQHDHFNRLEWLTFKQFGFTREGKRRSDIRVRRYRFKRELRRLGDNDNYTPQVYADFLEESGFPDAAMALRKRFPLADGS